MEKKLGFLMTISDYSRVDEEEYTDWYDTEHIPERAALPGFLTAERYMVLGEKRSITMYDLSGPEAVQSPEYKAISGDNFTPWTKRLYPKISHNFLRFVAEQAVPGAEQAPGTAGAVRVIGYNALDPEKDETVNGWFDKELLPVFRGIEGTLACRRYRCVKEKSWVEGGAFRNLLICHVTVPEVLEGDAWKQAEASCLEYTVKNLFLDPNILNMTGTLHKKYFCG